MRKWWLHLMLLAAVAVAALGLVRLKFDTDILSMLPGNLPEVKGLKALHQFFDREDEAILVLQGEPGDDSSLTTRAESLAKWLEKDGVVKRARWQPHWSEDPEGIGELFAYLWMNSDPAEVQALADRLAAGKSKETLRDSLERLSTTIEGQDMVLRAHDPFGFLDHPAVHSMLGSGAGGSGFLSPDGSSHLLFAEAPHPVHGYREAATWLADVRKSIAAWTLQEGHGCTVAMTGEPVFASEIGTAMEYDLSGSITVTLGLIGLLFWWMQRRLMLLGGLVVILSLVFAVALGIAGWIYGELSIIALSSAEILIGLATDYGLVICQEAKVAGHDRKALLQASGRPVLCGALTTTVVFLALNLGGLPGMAQLGTIVAVGLAAAGVLMIVFYLPWVVKFGVDRQPADDEARWLPRKKRSWLITGLLVVISLGILGFLGMPGVEFDSKIMRPRNSTAMAGLELMQEKFPDRDPRLLRVLVEAPDDATMHARLEEAVGRLEKAHADGVLLEKILPTVWWPDISRQDRNRATLAALAAESPRLLVEADEAGFSEEGTSLGRLVLKSLAEDTARSGLIIPQSSSAKEIMDLFMMRRDDGSGFVMGTVLPAKDVDPDTPGYPRLRELNGEGIYLSGWSLFKPAISSLVKDDLSRMLLPMGLLLLGMMAFIFRRLRDVWLAVFTMIVGTVVMLAIMKLCGLKWNFVNLMATPLLLGTGIDYAIHVTLTLRRTGSCFKELWNGTGKALLFCGASNVIGFGSLCFSSSDALVSLGQVAVIGILVSMLASLFLLPGWHSEPSTQSTHDQ